MTRRQEFSVRYQYDVLFSRSIFSPSNDLLVKLLGGLSATVPVRIVVAIDDGVVQHHPILNRQISNYCSSNRDIELLADPLVVMGGEQTKNSLDEFMKVLQLINDAKVDRHAFVIAIGGGAVLDMIGFAAAVSHRGIRHVRVPTTVLSQNDSGVGVKNGINFFGKKNFLGTFAPPAAVINDFDFLETLDERDWRAGCSEAVKVALIKDKLFFEWLEKHAVAIKNHDNQAMEKLIKDCADHHLQHIRSSDDPFEMGSSRPLDFGHWAAHKLEQLSDFSIRHGEAVSIGIALDVGYALFAGFIDQETFERVLKTLTSMGLEVFHRLLLTADGSAVNPDLIQGLEEFREHLGGELTIPMISGLGERFDVHELKYEWIQSAAKLLAEKQELYAY